MSPDRLGATICLIAVTVVAIARLPSVIRSRSARPSWVAVVVGGAAFVSTGAVIPLETLDATLGGQNYISLVQNSLAVIAFWLLLEASRARSTGVFNWRRSWQLLVVIGSFTIPFLLIQYRQGTSADFVNDYADQLGLWAYASIYMSWVATLVLLTTVAVRGRRSVMYFGIRLGCVMVAAASIAEILYLTLRVAGAPSSGAVEMVRLAFPPLFYGGVAAIAAGLAGFWLVRAVRVLVLSILHGALRRAHASQGEASPTELTGAPAVDAYRMAVAIVDVGNTRGLGWWERSVLAVATRVLDRQTMAPRIVKMKISPLEVLP